MECKRLIGYHGTTTTAYHKIKKDGFLHRYNKRHWLGQGVYFFMDDFNDAMNWAKHNTQNPDNDQLCVIKAEIVVAQDKHLNLDTVNGNKVLMDYYELVLKELLDAGIEAKNLNEKQFACTVIDAIPSEEFEVITRSFKLKVSDKGKYNRDIFEKRHTQICVRKNNRIDIKKVFRSKK